MSDDPFLSWFEALEKRHLAELTFAEVRRGAQALSSLYVERRGRLSIDSALSGAGKRAAFAMFYGPLHYLLVREIVRALDARLPRDVSILDLGCGTGVAGAAWAVEMNPAAKLTGVDRHPWVLQEAKWTYRRLGIRGAARTADVSSFLDGCALPGLHSLRSCRVPLDAAVIAAFTMNEIDAVARDRFRTQLLNPLRTAPVLIVEPIARPLTKWWDAWARDFIAAGGREDEWRFGVELPERLRLMDRASGLDHRELTGRSLWIAATRDRIPRHVLP